MLVSILLAFSLNFDTFSVAIIEGAQINHSALRQSLKAGLIFGFVQALMALVGALIGIGSRTVIVNLDHWIAFALLSFVGGKMIYAVKADPVKTRSTNHAGNRSLILLAVATSIDALIVGITLAFMKQSVIMDISIIGIISFAASFTGFYIGRKLEPIFKNKINILGGFVLIAIGIKILIEHLLFN